MGIPTVTLTRTGFVGLVKNAVSGLGLAPDASVVTFPIEAFLPDSDLALFNQRKQDIYDGLTRWRPEAVEASEEVSRMLHVDAATYKEALVKANHLFLRNHWGDGLPLWPATREDVDWILQGSDLPRATLLGKFPPLGGLTTVETCAVALAMAGGRPEYLPVLIAAVEAFLDPASESAHLQATSGGPFPVLIVNGPIGKQIRMSSGFGCLGPDPKHPAGGTIGRALRLLQQNVGGALPGTGTMAAFGGMRYTNVVFAEDELGLPPGWEPHATERHGYPAGTNSVSLAFASGATNIKRSGAKEETAEEDALQGMYRTADFLRTPNMSCLSGYEAGTPGILMITRVVAQAMANLGWTKRSIRTFLWEHSRIPGELLRRAGGIAWIELETNPVTRASLQLDPWPITAKPENLVVVVAGGEHPTHSYWLQGYSPAVTGRQIKLSKSFERLIAEAEHDLGHPADDLSHRSKRNAG